MGLPVGSPYDKRQIPVARDESSARSPPHIHTYARAPGLVPVSTNFVSEAIL